LIRQTEQVVASLTQKANAETLRTPFVVFGRVKELQEQTWEFILRMIRLISRFNSSTLAAVTAWAYAKAIGVIIGTDLPSNFQKACGCSFSVINALSHFRALDEEAKSSAAEYVLRAPAFVNTLLRKALQTEPWFNHGG
jgi:hypothetical protein